MKPTRDKFTILKQVMSIIPPYLTDKLAREYGVDKQSRSFCRRALQNVPGLGTSKCTTPFRERYTIPRSVCSLKACNFSLLSG